ncbi:branched-chain amino acid ABC transporter permease [Nitratireductor alexandrii]|uniref:branched-chain amino acid ABC transporter permease n=1 Tax=Nitratireductor alexandrii TaxID=2448161 RepID=UPI000FD81ED8|nr:branched-chain amino acid ABC transporter permease [Nitratireductor alexandrii]
MIDWQTLSFQIVNGVVWAMFLGLIALGLNAIFGLLGLLNMAHGAVYAVGAVIAWYTVSELGNFWFALVIAPLFAAAISVPVYRFILRPTIGKDMMVGLVATSGLLFIISDLLLATFGGSPRLVPPPVSGAVGIMGFYYPTYRLVAAAMAIAVLATFWAFLRLTAIGLWIRCVAQSPTLAMASGVPVEKVYLVIVVLSAALAALAGVLIAPMTMVSHQMGLAVLGPAFIVVVVGGLGNLAGAVAAAVMMGVARGVLSVFLPPTYAEVGAIVMFLPLLLLRPNGIFGGRA